MLTGSFADHWPYGMNILKTGSRLPPCETALRSPNVAERMSGEGGHLFWKDRWTTLGPVGPPMPVNDEKRFYQFMKALNK